MAGKMSDAQLKAKIATILREGCFNHQDDAVYVLDGPDGNLHVVVVSPQFQGRRLAEKRDLILGDLISGLEEDEWGRVTLSVGVTPEEITTMI